MDPQNSAATTIYRPRFSDRQRTMQWRGHTNPVPDSVGSCALVATRHMEVEEWG
jgi:hypothetical protein